MDFVIERGNIIYCDTDAVVLPANKHLKEGSGTSHAIFSAAGRKQLSKECKKYGECELGMAVPTPGYKLDAKYIIHAVVPKWIDGNNNEYEYLSSAYIAALDVADTMKCNSIAFPLLSAGNNGFERSLAFNIAVKSIAAFKGNNIKKVILMVYTEELAVYIKSQGYDVFESEEYKTEKLKKEKHKKEFRTIIIDGKEVAIEFAEDAIKKGLEFMKDEENRRLIIDAGFEIAKNVLSSSE